MKGFAYLELAATKAQRQDLSYEDILQEVRAEADHSRSEQFEQAYVDAAVAQQASEVTLSLLPWLSLADSSPTTGVKTQKRKLLQS